MKLVWIGIAVIALGYAWLFTMPLAGSPSDWWYFRWSEFKPIFGAFHIAGGLIIGLGVLSIRKNKKSALIKPAE